MPREHRGRAAMLTLTAAVATALSLAGAPAAHAAPSPGLEVSDDGKSFQRSIDSQLFSGLGRVVPGDSGKDSVWIRNQSEQTGTLRLELVKGWTNSAALAGATTLNVKVEGRRVSTPLAAPLAKGVCVVVSPSLTIKPGQTVRFDASLSIDRALGNRTGRDGALKSMGFQVRAAAVDAAVPQDERPECGAATTPWEPPSSTATGTSPGTGQARPEDNLVKTGADVGGWLLLGGGLSVAGLFLAARRCRGDHA